MHVELVREFSSLPGPASHSATKLGYYVLPVIRHVISDTEQARDEQLKQVTPLLDAKISHVIEYHRSRQISFVDVFNQGQLQPVT